MNLLNKARNILDNLNLVKQEEDSHYNINIENENLERINEGYKNNYEGIKAINTELAPGENTKVQTKNGAVELECNQGYADNFVIEGETLFNLYDRTTFTKTTNEWNHIIILNDNVINNMLSIGKYSFLFKGNFIKGLSCEIGSKITNTLIRRVEFESKNSVIEINENEKITNFFIDKNLCTLDELGNIVYMLMVLEGDMTEKEIPHFLGLQSVGQGDKIEVLSYKTGDNLLPSNLTWTLDKYIDSETGNLVTLVDLKTCNEFIKIDSEKTYTFLDINGQIALYDKNKTLIPIHHNVLNPIRFTTKNSIFNDNFVLKIPKYVAFIKINVATNTSPNTNPCIYEGASLDHKIINNTLRGIKNIDGTYIDRDIIKKEGTTYYKIKKYHYMELNANNVVSMLGSNENCLIFQLKNNDLEHSVNAAISDKFKNVRIFNTGYEHFYNEVNNAVNIEILKSRLETPDIEGFKKWLNVNSVPIIYPLKTPIIEELINFNPLIFKTNTIVLVNSGVVQAEAQFEVTNTLRSEIDVLEKKTSDVEQNLTTLTTNVDGALLELNKCQKHKITQNDGRPFVEGVSNLNDVKFQFERKCIVDPNSLNTPNNKNYWYVECMGNSQFVKQEATTYASTEVKKYIRVKSFDGWTPWRSL